MATEPYKRPYPMFQLTKVVPQLYERTRKVQAVQYPTNV